MSALCIYMQFILVGECNKQLNSNENVYICMIISLIFKYLSGHVMFANFSRYITGVFQRDSKYQNTQAMRFSKTG